MNDDYLCIEEVEKTVHVALSPSVVGPKVSGVIEVLEGWKRQYIKQLSGVVVNFKNVSLSSGLGSIMTDQLFIHYDVKAVFSIFKPCVGNILRGTINRISREHVGCVVHDVINVSIHLDDDMEDNISKYIVLENVIYFKVTNVDFHRRLIRVNGRITMDCIELMKKYSLTNTVKNKRVVFSDALLYEEESDLKISTCGNDNNNSSNSNKFSVGVSEPVDIDNEYNLLNAPVKSEFQTDGSKNIPAHKKKVIDDSASISTESDDSQDEEYTNIEAIKEKMENDSDTDSSNLTDNEVGIKIKKEINHTSSDTHKNKKKLKLDKSKGEDDGKKHKKSKGKKNSEVDGSKSSTHKKSKSSKKIEKSKENTNYKETAENKSPDTKFKKSKESPDKNFKKSKERSPNKKFKKSKESSPDKKLKKSKESTENKKSHKKKKKSGDELSPEKKIKSSKEKKKKDKKKDSDQKKSKKRKLNTSTKDTSEKQVKKIKLELPD